MSYTPSAAAQATATLAGSNEASLAAPLVALQNAISGGLLAPAAFMDAILSSVGFQLESNNALSSASTSSTLFADVAGSSITFTAPLAKTYVVHADFSVVFSVAGQGQARLVVNGSTGPSIWLGQATANVYRCSVHLMHSAACASGANTIKLQWAVLSGATMGVGSNDYANYIVTG